MTGTISPQHEAPDDERAASNFSQLMGFVTHLYCGEDSSSVSALEARELALSVTYALGIANATPNEAARALDVDDPITLWRCSVAALEQRLDSVLALWQEVVTLMPPIHNVALRDTLASLGDIKRRYDPRFAAHEVPCDIDYQLSEPVNCDFMGLDYIEAWLEQLLEETRWIAQFDTSGCIAVLERACPDYRGLHVNLYDLLAPHEDELRPR